MTEGGPPPPVRPGHEAALLAVAALVAAVLFLLFSFLTFGLPLVVVALAAVIWTYVGIMRFIEALLARWAAWRQHR
jgi:hypothetical protein